MTHPQENVPYTPCWAVVPNLKSKPEMTPELACQDANSYIEHLLFWLTVAFAALGMYVAVSV
ncbi:MAG TPA: hypothetical protein VFC46_03400 [Humisphaera sp.]|nr:hypothetical protein [Humisphaera sp.]